MTLAIQHYPPEDRRHKIAIVQPGSWGDCVNSTLMFKPLKAHWPNSLIDVYTSSLYASAFYNNPFINKLIEVPTTTRDQSLHLVKVIPPLLTNVYDVVCNPHPMVNGDKWTSIRFGELGTNLICAWVRALEDLGVPFELPLETILELTPAEVENAQFCMSTTPGRNVLMEVESRSGQAFWDLNWTLAVGRHLLNGNTNLYISRQSAELDVIKLKEMAPDRVHFIGHRTLRECAEVFNRCDIFFSVSSGLSNACNTSWCKKTGKWFETINSEVVSSAPIRRDGKVFWYENDIPKFIEMLKSHGV